MSASQAVLEYEDVVLCGAVSLLGAFGLGVSWAAYRAVGWVERMKAWARTVELNEQSGCGLAVAELEGMGQE